ncbi:MAG: prolyl oligopeptidase family serine peptidase [Steroidobacteraceae bacterium]|jgi:dipeptidyl aminopeptidase/acylaminoacyl peptidase
MQNRRSVISMLLAASWAALSVSNAAPAADFSMSQALDYPDASELAAAENADVIAWVRTFEGVRNIWIARGPEFKPVRITNYREDDGQEITQLTFAPDGSRLVYVLGGDHDANWPAEGNLAPDPASATRQPQVAIWAAPLAGGEPVKIADGDAPAISSRGELAYTQDDHVWSAPIEGGKPERLFFDRGKDSDLRWSPDGSRLAFVSKRGDHSFIGIYSSKSAPISYLEPSTNLDSSPRWSPDGSRLAFVRQPGDGGPPEPILTQVPHPWSLWVAPSNGGAPRRVWQSPDSLAGSYPDVAGEANLQWAAGDRLVFLAYLDDWPHLYSVPAAGGEPMLLTPGAYMVEHVAMSRDRRFVIYDANTGKSAGDDDRRHIYRVPVDRAASVALSSGESIDWTPIGASDNRVAYIAAGSRHPPSVMLVDVGGAHRGELDTGAMPADFPLGRLITPKRVIFRSADGIPVHGQLFDTGGEPAAAKPAVLFVHGGPPRQMLLGWHYMDYYANAYAVNQYLAAHGFVVLSVNYRLGIGYGRAFHQPDHAGFAGAAEYQDIVAGAHYLQTLSDVDGARLGIWGGSYGGYLTGLALARNSDLFRAGVDLHGVHDWSRLLDAWVGKGAGRYEKGDREQAMKVAWESSPDAGIDAWRSPVLLIQGDDDRNVPFEQTVDLARRLEMHHIPYEELVIPNEIHGFLRHASWLRVDEATVEFLTRRLGQAANGDAASRDEQKAREGQGNRGQ